MYHMLVTAETIVLYDSGSVNSCHHEGKNRKLRHNPSCFTEMKLLSDAGVYSSLFCIVTGPSLMMTPW